MVRTNLRPKKLVGIPHQSKQIENLSFPQALLTPTVASKLWQARLKASHVRGVLHAGRDFCWYSQQALRPLDEKCQKVISSSWPKRHHKKTRSLHSFLEPSRLRSRELIKKHQHLADTQLSNLRQQRAA